MSVSGEITVTEEKTGDSPRGSPAEYIITREKQLTRLARRDNLTVEFEAAEFDQMKVCCGVI